MVLSKRGRELAETERQRITKAHRQWCERHPDRAAEERQIRKDLRSVEANFGHVTYGTPETRARASNARQGALARLHRTGAISIHQLGAALEIAAAYERICMSAGIPTCWAIERVDSSFRPGRQDFEAIGAVWSEYAYSQWRRALPSPGPVLAMIVEDVGIEAAARRFAMHRRRAKRLLLSALDLWAVMHRQAREAVNDDTLEAAHRAVM